MRLATLGLAGFGFFVLTGAALGHHSFAMFDPERTITLEGTIADFLWTNPHSWIRVRVENAQGEEEEWAVEMGGPAGLARSGTEDFPCVSPRPSAPMSLGLAASPMGRG